MSQMDDYKADLRRWRHFCYQQRRKRDRRILGLILAVLTAIVTVAAIAKSQESSKPVPKWLPWVFVSAWYPAADLIAWTMRTVFGEVN